MDKECAVCSVCRKNGKLSEWQHIHKYNIAHVCDGGFEVLHKNFNKEMN